MENITVNMENLNTEEREQLMTLIKKANAPKSKMWRPMHGESYYYINSVGSIECSKYNSYVHENRFLIGNCFKTEAEAKFTVEHLKVLNELRQFASDSNNGQFILCCSNSAECRNVEILSCLSYTGELHFTTTNDAYAAIKAVGEDRIKKYYFNMED